MGSGSGRHLTLVNEQEGRYRKRSTSEPARGQVTESSKSSLPISACLKAKAPRKKWQGKEVGNEPGPHDIPNLAAPRNPHPGQKLHARKAEFLVNAETHRLGQVHSTGV